MVYTYIWPLSDPIFSFVCVQIHIVKFYKMDKEEAYIHFKGLGNTAFKNSNYPLAIEEYTKAIDLLEDEGEFKVKDQMDENLEDVRKHSHKHAHALAILYSNRAQTQLKLENYGLAINDCTISIEHDGKFVKSLYRRAVANYAIRELNVALRDCKEAKTLAPNDLKIKMLATEISREIKRIKFEEAIDVAETSVFEKISWSDFDSNKELDLVFDENGRGIAGLKGLDREFINKMVAKFRNNENIAKYDAFAIVSYANQLLRTEKSMVEIGYNQQLENNNRDFKYLQDVETITVCGDTHGQFFDVLNIFDKFGQVSEDHAYLFNGDFVDRGSWGCEVALLLYALKILYPNRIFINRGNHETDDMNSVYGFKDECKFKYGEKLFKCFSESFGSLPYCTLINGEYLVMHGGLFSDDSITVKDLKEINRFNQSHGQPPKSGVEMELLWTDPQTESGRSLSKRGIGMQFGPDITKAFCVKNQIKGVIRSHEVRQNGYEWEHNGMLCTVFSAPNYCDVQGNLGGVINMVRKDPTGAEMELQCENFAAVPHPDIPPMKYTKNQFGF